MDTPQISTLREKSTPPPSKSKSNPGFRLKLVLGKDKTKTIASSSTGRHASGVDDDEQDEDEDQEDQLIDDEAPPVASSSKSSTSKRKAAVVEASPSRKRKSRKTENGKVASEEAGSSAKQKGPDGKASSKPRPPAKRQPLARARGKIKPKPVPAKSALEEREETAEDECWISFLYPKRPPGAVPWKALNTRVIKVKKAEAKKTLLEYGVPPAGGWNFGPDGPNGEVNMQGVPTVRPPKKPKPVKSDLAEDEMYITVPNVNHHSYTDKRRKIAWVSTPMKTIKVKRSEADKVYEQHWQAIRDRHLKKNNSPSKSSSSEDSGSESGSDSDSDSDSDSESDSEPKQTQTLPEPEAETTVLLRLQPETLPGSGSVPIGSLDTQPTPQTNITVDELPTLSLEGVAIPVYPLPTKPFPVLPPPKISTGVAPTIPLDRTKAQPRHWRVANREIRGIGGGRWFTRTWVGEKESEFANAMQARKIASTEESESGSTAVSGVAPQASAGPSGKGSRKKGASQSKHVAEHVDGGSISARKPSKMRISQVAPPSSDGGDIGITDGTGM